MHGRHERAARLARNSLNKRNPFSILFEAILPSRAHAATVGLRHTLSAYAPLCFTPMGFAAVGDRRMRRNGDRGIGE